MNRKQATKIGLILASPLLIYFLIFFIYPIFLLFRYAFTNTAGSFSLSNFVYMSKDPILYSSLYNTLYYFIGSVAVQFSGGFLAAIVLNSYTGRLKNTFRMILYIPLTISPIVIALIWLLIFNPTYGPIDYILRTPINWLGSLNLAMPTIIVANGWEYIPFVFLIIYAGLQAVPKQYYEAASIDGMNRLQTFRYITMPSITPILVVAFLLNSIGILQGFTLVYVLTNGGPGFSTYILSFYIYKVAFAYFNLHYAAALSLLFIFIIGAFVYAMLKLTSVERYLGLKRENAGDE
ncbi:MAG: sugar ABC transporter permease [Thaumarchaeota archaeon]|jgi:multiple sugar transport system permease protein|nr:sugar ABC transporter permease [Nitrososphaerota archaeon]